MRRGQLNNLVDLVDYVSERLKTPKYFICVECKQLINKPELDGYPHPVWFVDLPHHRDCAPRCERCGEVCDDYMALVADGLVHATCMRKGEQIA